MLRLTRESLLLDAIVELNSLVVQLLLAVKQSHERGVCHGKFLFILLSIVLISFLDIESSLN